MSRPKKIAVLVAILGLAAAADLFSHQQSIAAMVWHGAARALGRSGDPVHVLLGGNGNACGDEAGSATTKRSFDWPEGQTRLDLAAPARLIYRTAGSREIYAEGPAALVQHLRVEGGHISFDCNWGGLTEKIGDALQITVSGLVIEQFDVSGAAQLDLAEVEQPHLSIKLSGAAKIDGGGRTDRLDLSISGAGKVDLGKLVAKTAEVKLSGAADARLAVEDKADVHIAGIGHVSWAKRPAQISSHIAGMGVIDDAEN